ncbi:MAG TPA: chemotaxis protein CheD [Virgibacillus sp.]|nr:chemotaxis protein CheD [Virgibacillus sp.]
MNKTATVVKVGISDLNIARAPDTIRTSGLGSCVGAIVYDLSKEIAGLAHIMLPDSSLTREENFNKFKYANTAIPYMIKKLQEHGARSFALQAKLAGGAQMFQFSTQSNMMRIGPRNVDAVKKILKEHRIPVMAEDVGGSSGRTIEFDPVTGRLKVRTVNKGEKYI